MKKYFIHDGVQQHGPMDIAELKEKKIAPDTQVWHDGLNEWTMAKNLEELKNIFVQGPPPFSRPATTSPPSPPPSSEEQSNKRNASPPKETENRSSVKMMFTILC